jgi:hypothetical protein
MFCDKIGDFGLLQHAIGQVTLVSDEETRTLGAIVQRILLVQIGLPTGAGLERLAAHQVEHDQAEVRVLVVDMGHVDVSLLATDVPELYVELLVVPRLDLLRAEFNFIFKEKKKAIGIVSN